MTNFHVKNEKSVLWRCGHLYFWLAAVYMRFVHKARNVFIFMTMNVAQDFCMHTAHVTCSMLSFVFVCSAWLFLLARTVRTEPLFLNFENCEVQDLCS